MEIDEGIEVDDNAKPDGVVMLRVAAAYAERFCVPRRWRDDYVQEVVTEAWDMCCNDVSVQLAMWVCSRRALRTLVRWQDFEGGVLSTRKQIRLSKLDSVHKAQSRVLQGYRDKGKTWEAPCEDSQ